MKKSSVAVGLLAAVVLVLFVAVGYFLTRPYAAEAPHSSSETLLTDLPKDWQSYVGLGFAIGYPNDWVLDKTSEAKGMIWLRTKERQADVDAQKIVRVFDVAVTAGGLEQLPGNEKDRLSLADWVKNKAEEQGLVDVEPYVVGGVSGFRGKKENPEIPGAFNLTEVVENDGKIFMIEVEGEMTSQKEQVLRSFALTQRENR